ncbi:MAG: DegQ family serine endoprotease [Rhodanobacteraceae bacterium]|nr:DegQ family serine endoprotease [Rhodanobacteraceae bacterium]MBL0041390.1 DegQ family serine endoprotease [Xanthomonadales bacterium]MBP6077398.1 DegQ family serine endoprotease [Xanthomonadales bacterium]MBP7622468.1 DegQ family serine endoprotease [Xanthomonadales bacterium]
MLKRCLQIAVFVAAIAVSPLRAQALPDFTQLVERNAPAVVNITARKNAPDVNDPSQLSEEEVPEIFRRFFGDPRQMPNPGGGERVSGGSGFVISADGYLMTNHHVVDGADEVTVRLKDRREFKAKVIGSDQQSDVALLKIEASGLTAATLGDSSKLKPGQWVVAIGSPYNLDFSVTAGIVSAVGRNLGDDQRYVPFIQNDAAINRGNSGGPLFNLDGQVVGINSQIFSNTGGSIGLSFAIPIDYANKVVAQLRSKGKVSRGYLGVGLNEIDATKAKAFGLSRVTGALVAQVNADTPAVRAGLKEGDVIVSVDGQKIERSGDLPPIIGATAPGTKVTLGIVRDGKPMTVPLVVGELPADLTAGGGRGTGPEAEPVKGDALGLNVRELSADEREQSGIDNGVLVENVTGSGARRIGLRPGDVVIMVGRKRVNSVADFKAAAAAIPKGESAMLLVRRGGSNSFIALPPEE